MSYNAVPGQIAHELKLPASSADAEYLESADFENWVNDEAQQLLWGHDATFVTVDDLHFSISEKLFERMEDCYTEALPKMLLLIATRQKNADGELCRLLMEIMGDTVPSDGLPARNSITELAEQLVRETADKHLQSMKGQREDV